MNWSFSTARMFRQCQRRWYFKTCCANARARDPIRHEAYLLSKLQSISAWRGRIVDDVISRYLVGALNRRQSITKAELLSRAREQYDRQLEAAVSHTIRNGNSRQSKDDGIVAFWCIEYGSGPTKEELATAWDEINAAISNLFEMGGIRSAMKAASRLLAQRNLQFAFQHFDGVNVRAVPDAIALYESAPPLIIDWKVHSFGTSDYRQQLALYAMALTSCRPHRDFPENLQSYGPDDIRVIEAQLLTKVEREYELSEDDFEQLEDHVGTSADEMLRAIDGGRNAELQAEDFAVTMHPSLCEKCQFLKLCWE